MYYVCIIGLTMVTHMLISRKGPVRPAQFLAWLLSYCEIEKSIPEYSRHRIIKTCLVISFAADPDQRKEIGSGSDYWFVTENCREKMMKITSLWDLLKK